ncbi:hypothetical protein PENTCL1PPCAC_8184, partial [Pristionchus entomophagus]
QYALDHDEHKNVMDMACWYYKSDDIRFIEVSRTIFDRTSDSGRFDGFHSTRYIGNLAFYLALNGNITPMLNWFGGKGKIAEAARLILLQKTLHPTWRYDVSEE